MSAREAASPAGKRQDAFTAMSAASVLCSASAARDIRQAYARASDETHIPT